MTTNIKFTDKKISLEGNATKVKEHIDKMCNQYSEMTVLEMLKIQFGGEANE